MKMATSFTILSAIVACSPIDRIEMSRFEPISSKSFKYVATADAAYPVDSPTAEKERMKWLETYLSDNRFCSGGYKITSRSTAIRKVGLLGDIVDVYYVGECLNS